MHSVASSIEGLLPSRSHNHVVSRLLPPPVPELISLHSASLTVLYRDTIQRSQYPCWSTSDKGVHPALATLVISPGECSRPSSPTLASIPVIVRQSRQKSLPVLLTRRYGPPHVR